MSDIAISKNGVRIRLTDERWSHIVEEHRELADLRLEVLDAISNPVRIVEGGERELLAVRELELGKYIVVVYREVSSDGFVITAFLTRRIGRLERRKQLWP
jgi:AMMECR1 domain-containing protein